MWYLILAMAGSGYPTPVALTIIPEKYPTQQACKDAGNGWLPNKFECVKAPAPISMCNMAVGNMSFPVPCDAPASAAGYYCGQYPDKCIISKPNCVQNLNSGKLECN